MPVQRCEICQEQFEQYWDDEEEEWRLRNAIRAAAKVSCPALQGMLSCGTGPEEPEPKGRAQGSVSPAGSPPHSSCLPVPSISQPLEALQLLVPAVQAPGLPLCCSAGRQGQVPADGGGCWLHPFCLQPGTKHCQHPADRAGSLFLSQGSQSPCPVRFGLFLPLPAQADGSCAAAAALFPAVLHPCSLLRGISILFQLYHPCCYQDALAGTQEAVKKP